MSGPQCSQTGVGIPQKARYIRHMRRGRGVGYALALGVCAAAGVLAAPSGAGSSHTSRAADGYFSLSITGPTSVALSRTAAPPRQEFDVTMTYIGPAFQDGDPPITGTITVQLSQQEMNFGIGCCLPPANCQDSVAPPNTPGVSWSCPWSIGPGNGTQWTFPVGARPTGVAGTGPLTVSLSTGASASLTTTYFYPDTTPTTTAETTTTATTTAATVAAAPPTTVTETFSASAPPQPESVPIAPSADTATVGLTWPSAGSSFDVTGVAIVSNGVVVARAPQVVPTKLTVTKQRTPTSLKVTVRPLVRGKLVFKIVARKLKGTVRVRATVRQTKHRSR
jgi:hypothetical protein